MSHDGLGGGELYSSELNGLSEVKVTTKSNLRYLEGALTFLLWNIVPRSCLTDGELEIGIDGEVQ